MREFEVMRKKEKEEEREGECEVMRERGRRERDGKRRRYGVMRVKEREIKQTDREINKMGKREMRPMTQDTVLFV